jgi:hypothetical protein
MYISLSTQAPNGATVAFHKILKIEIFGGVCSATINSYTASDSSLVSWQDTYEVPLSGLSSDPETSVAQWLVSTGAPFAGGSAIADAETDINIAKLKKGAEIKVAREIAMATSVTAFGSFDTSPDGKMNITGAAASLIILGEAATDITWKMSDDSIKIFTPTDFLHASLLVSQYVSGIYAQSWALQTLIDDAATVADVEAIVWV